MCASTHNITVTLLVLFCRFMCCVMLAVPLVATLLTAILRWQKNNEISPHADSCVPTGLSLYGTVETNVDYSSGMNSNTPEEISEYNLHFRLLHKCLLTMQRL